MSAFKAQAISRELRQRIEAAASGLTITEAQDSSFMPILKIVKGGETIYVKTEVEPNPSGGVDALDLQQRIYSPHRLTILRLEAAALVDAELRELVTAEATKAGAKTLIYEVDPVPASYDLTGAALIAEIKSNQWHPLTLSE